MVPPSFCFRDENNFFFQLVLRLPYRWSLLLLLAGPARAQFSSTASTTQFICNASGVQFGVKAFADGAGGAYSVWIDKRAGNNSGPGPARPSTRST